MHSVCLDMHLISCDVSEADIFLFSHCGRIFEFDGGCILNSWVRTSTHTHTLFWRELIKGRALYNMQTQETELKITPFNSDLNVCEMTEQKVLFTPLMLHEMCLNEAF